MDIGNKVYLSDRADWRKWLSENYDKEKEIWLVFPKKASGKPRIQYNDAVEEALCFGWIDSTAKRIDQNSYAQRFSPRNPKTPYSEANKQRLRQLIKAGLVLPSVEAVVKPILEEEFSVPSDILDEIKANEKAWDNFMKFSPQYKRIRVGFIEGARNRPQEFRKRLKYFIEMTEKNKQFGFGGIEKHY
ncbi:MAG TPA: YdeI/OmpD-associated family protein [Candidatus Sulfotelmatobacter sp.]|nr:YdeI/OmpD-associated family protein [Candidatus Sulfotelmatobacter sp.]